ncbi:MAG: hypothetical protein HN380_25805 [Victivallales bacterium]|nr:hypothetical protein [Victivallales bacterium]
MTVSYLNTQGGHGGEVQADDVGYRLVWPDGTNFRRAVFSRQEAEHPGTTLLSLEDSHVRGLTSGLPQFAPGQPFGSIVLDGVSDKVSGTWSLWRIALRTAENRSQRVMALFVSDEGRAMAPTARVVWDRLIGLGAQEGAVAGHTDGYLPVFQGAGEFPGGVPELTRLSTRLAQVERLA